MVYILCVLHELISVNGRQGMYYCITDRLLGKDDSYESLWLST